MLPSNRSWEDATSSPHSGVSGDKPGCNDVSLGALPQEAPGGERGVNRVPGAGSRVSMPQLAPQKQQPKFMLLATAVTVAVAGWSDESWAGKTPFPSPSPPTLSIGHLNSLPTTTTSALGA